MIQVVDVCSESKLKPVNLSLTGSFLFIFGPGLLRFDLAYSLSLFMISLFLACLFEFMDSF